MNIEPDGKDSLFDSESLSLSSFKRDGSFFSQDENPINMPESGSPSSSNSHLNDEAVVLESSAHKESAPEKESVQENPFSVAGEPIAEVVHDQVGWSWKCEPCKDGRQSCCLL